MMLVDIMFLENSMQAQFHVESEVEVAPKFLRNKACMIFSK